jgi:hypothetical protein
MTEISKCVMAFIIAALLLGTAGLTLLTTAFFVMPAAALDAGSKDPAKVKASKQAPAIGAYSGSGGGAGKIKGTKPKPALRMSGADMYSAYCRSRFGRWPRCDPLIGSQSETRAC